jgi:hypothetical protein
MPSDPPSSLNRPEVTLSPTDRKLLETIAEKHSVPVGLIFELLAVENDLSGMGRRHGLNERINDLLTRFLRQ